MRMFSSTILLDDGIFFKEMTQIFITIYIILIRNENVSMSSILLSADIESLLFNCELISNHFILLILFNFWWVKRIGKGQIIALNQQKC